MIKIRNHLLFKTTALKSVVKSEFRPENDLGPHLDWKWSQNRKWFPPNKR